MARANTSHGSRAASLLPLLAGVTSALALTGAAVYTVGKAGCEPGQYVRHDHRVELVGGCVSGADLRDAGVGHRHKAPSAQVSGAAHTDDGRYRP